MLRDIYAIPNSEGRYKPGVIEVNNDAERHYDIFSLLLKERIIHRVSTIERFSQCPLCSENFIVEKY